MEPATERRGSIIIMNKAICKFIKKGAETFSLRLLVLICFIMLAAPVLAITGEQIISKVDDNMTFDSARMEAEMVIHVGDQVRTKTMVSYSQGRDKSFSEFLSPPRDKGVKYLKIEDNMWMYLPSVDKIIKIAGHMLRQSMMGSDFSYEDALESSKLLEKYDVGLVTEEITYVKIKKGTEEVTKGRPCYVLALTAKVKDVTYYKRKIWVDREIFVPVKEELFAKSGKKLKVTMLGDVRKYGSRYYPTYISMQNLLRSDSLTEMVVTKAQFGIRIPKDTFTQRNLKK
ncbi:MAG: outer membrane lipoprotein-sorting protein [Candidatus Margulisbacteria bacterium]|nr:outer membrane lipoprotein-sorting protein [Candidatus Margulisiibacteriota bacterium]